MREIRTYGATSGDWKRSYDEWIEAPASPENGHSPLSAATAPVIDSTVVVAPVEIFRLVETKSTPSGPPHSRHFDAR